MTYEEDFELAARLRRVSADPEPEMPASLYRFADQVAEAATVGGAEPRNVPIPIGLARGARVARRSPVRVLAGLAAVLVVALAAGTFLFVVQRGGPAANQSFAADDWTGLEWHDITATSDGLFKTDAWTSGGGRQGVNVVSFNGRFFAIDNEGMRTSLDARTWTRVPGAPELDWLGVLNGKLVGQGTALLPAPWTSWTSTDGVTWQSHVESFAGPTTGMGNWVTTSTAALVDVADMSADLPSASPAATSSSGTSHIAPNVPYSETAFYVTTDGISWRKGTLPTDMPGHQGVQFFSGGDVFLMEATIDDPAGRGYRQDAQGKNIAQADHLWTSRDGQSWTRIDTTAVGEFLGALYTGSLGESILGIVSNGFHSVDGVKWTRDQDKISIVNNDNMGNGSLSVQGDGRHILVSADWSVKFSVSRGDGHWRTLQQGGDIGSLPGGGQSFLLPDGVLYAGGGRLFYGEALVGTQPTGQLHPAATITAAPTPTPVGFTPRPKETQAPAVSWAGVTGIAKLAVGPAGATSVTRWKNGFIALANATDVESGSFTAWSSPDGISWTKIPDGTFGQHPTAEAAQDGDLVDIATWGGTVEVWSSGDGLTWQQAAISGPPIGGRPMAGNSQGVVALMDDPNYTIFSDMGNSVILNTGLNSLHSVAVSNGRWVVVGQVNGTSPMPAGPAAWWSEDGVAWTEASIDSASGESLVNVVAGRDGFIAIGSTDGTVAKAISFWTSADGKSWHRESAMGPFPGAASFAGDGNRIIGWGRGASGQTEYWTSQDGTSWTQLTLSGDTGALLSAKSAYAFPVANGVLFTTADGAWYGASTVQK